MSTSATWNSDENVRLKEAIHQYPNSMDKQERWRYISFHVETRSKRECYNQYKQLKRQYRKKKERVIASTSAHANMTMLDSCDEEHNNNRKAKLNYIKHNDEPKKNENPWIEEEKESDRNSRVADNNSDSDHVHHRHSIESKTTTPPSKFAAIDTAAANTVPQVDPSLVVEDFEDEESLHLVVSAELAMESLSIEQDEEEKTQQQQKQQQLTKPGKQQRVQSNKSQQITLAAAEAIRNLLFGSRRPNALNEAWKHQGLVFDTQSCLGFGLIQHKGGPCGLIAVIQALVLRHLLFEPVSAPGQQVNQHMSWQNPTEKAKRLALGRAVSGMIWQAASQAAMQPTRKLETETAKERADQNPVDHIEAVIATGCSKPMGGVSRRSSTYKPDGLTENVAVRFAYSLEETTAIVLENMRVYMQPRGPGAALVLYSVMLSRGVGVDPIRSPEEMRGVHRIIELAPNLANDMDASLDGSQGSLIGSHNYAGQELVNLLLIGLARSNVFDGVRDMSSGDDALILRGIPHVSNVGFLTLFEHYKYVSVGEHLKHSQVPVWVVCSESHYSVLFSAVPWEQMKDDFDLFYYDELGCQDELYRLSVSTGRNFEDQDDDRELVPPLDRCIRTVWPGAEVDWNGADPLL